MANLQSNIRQKCNSVYLRCHTCLHRKLHVYFLVLFGDKSFFSPCFSSSMLFFFSLMFLQGETVTVCSLPQLSGCLLSCKIPGIQKTMNFILYLFYMCDMNRGFQNYLRSSASVRFFFSQKKRGNFCYISFSEDLFICVFFGEYKCQLLVGQKAIYILTGEKAERLVSLLTANSVADISVCKTGCISIRVSLFIQPKEFVMVGLGSFHQQHIYIMNFSGQYNIL